MFYDQPMVDVYTQPVINIVVKEEQKPEPQKPKLYKIVPNDNLTKIATAHQTSIERLWAANTQLTDPNTIEVNQELRIPLNDEVLANRPLPAKIEVVYSLQSQTSAPSGRSSVSGSKWYFPPGYCTFYASQQRPDLPVRGNAGEWIKWSNGTVPKVGAVAVNTWAAGGYGHVAIVTAIDGNRVQVTHMNYRGFGKVTTDWTDASYWAGYIY